MIELVKVVQTGLACPAQWDAWDTEGQYYYLRYRFGHGTVDMQPGPMDEVGADAWSLKGTVSAFRTSDDDSYDEIGLSDFVALAGLTLSPGCVVT